MVGLGFINESNAPTEDAKKELPCDLECLSSEVLEKTVFIS